MADQSDLLDPSADMPECSPLERVVTRDGATVSIRIYRGKADPGWLLEIEDELGGSTSWDDPFDTDQAALDEALRAIEEEGIHSFAEQEPDPALYRRLWNAVVAQPDIAALRRILASGSGTISFDCACGVIAAVVSTPEMPAPSEWLGLIQGDHLFRDVSEAQRFTNGVMALYNEVLRSITELHAHCCPAPEDHDAVREFCVGYAMIASKFSAWDEGSPANPLLMSVFALAGAVPQETLEETATTLGKEPEDVLRAARAELPNAVKSLHAYWAAGRNAAAERSRQRHVPHRREAPKVGRNERCPCGSGKKFKKCCAQ